MEERVDRLIPYGHTDFWVCTFHAFGERVLRNNSLELGIAPDFDILSAAEQVVLFRENLFDFPLSHYRPLGNPTRFIQAVLLLIARAKDEDVTPGSYQEHVQKLERQLGESLDNSELCERVAKQRELAAVFEQYQGLLARESKLDFGDLITLTLKLFRSHPAVLADYQRRFRYILIDEFQDTNYAQFQLVKLLAGSHRNVTAVGDDDQSVYKFRGAAISNILGFLDTYPDARLVALTRNYRSAQRILNICYRLIQHNNPDRLESQQGIDKRLVAERDNDAVVSILHHDTLLTEAERVAGLIKQQVEQGKSRWSDCAILVRANDHARPFLNALNVAGIPWRFSGNEGLYNQEEVRLLISFLRAIVKPDDSLSLYYLASSQVYRMPALALSLCMSHASRANMSLLHVMRHLDEIAALKNELSAESVATVDRLLLDLEQYAELGATLSTGELLYRFITGTGLLAVLTKDPSTTTERKVKNIARFFDLVRRSCEVLRENRVATFMVHLDTLIEAGDNPPIAEAELDEDAVNVLTIHKAKGLEFPVVFMVSLVRGRFPSSFRREPIPLPDELVADKLPGGDFHRQEERRLFYVGMTRARDELYLTSAEDYAGRRLRKISPFVLEATSLSPEDIPISTSGTMEAIERNAPQVESYVRSRRQIPEDQTLSLSYFQIDDYLTCPLKYKYVHILRVPVMQHHTIVYGKALHDAVQHYYRFKMQRREPSLEDLIACFESAWVSEGFLSKRHERARFQKGKDTLAGFYTRSQNEATLPTYIEKEFSFWHGRDRVIGRWDRVDVVDGWARITDFKSSEITKPEVAERRVKGSLQLSIYALAYQQIVGKVPEEVGLHFLDTGLAAYIRPNDEMLKAVGVKIEKASKGIRHGVFAPEPGYVACRYCPYQRICPSR